MLSETVDFDGVLQAVIAVANAVAAPPESPWDGFVRIGGRQVTLGRIA